jgi:hypothetical protein
MKPARRRLVLGQNAPAGHQAQENSDAYLVRPPILGMHIAPGPVIDRPRVRVSVESLLSSWPTRLPGVA